ncbi:MAG: anti-sigma F factor [Clostridia bacterium]|nr:anti-sigma F factor [Clostridia bacterium]
MKKQNKPTNEFKMQIPSCSVNESFSRKVCSDFLMPLDPNLSDLSDIRTAVSEAVTNCIVHAYKEQSGTIYISGKYFSDRTVHISIKDKGCGIPDVEKAMEPLFTTDTSGERGGIGFAIMNSFSDRLIVKSSVGKGTKVTMIKKLK